MYQHVPHFCGSADIPIPLWIILTSDPVSESQEAVKLRTVTSTTWTHPHDTWLAIWSLCAPLLKVWLDGFPSLGVGTDRHAGTVSSCLVWICQLF
jgi:hypothetical protein